MLFLVDALTKPGQIVLDPFSGIGSTLVAASLPKRAFVGCDVSQLYYRFAKKRLAELSLPEGASHERSPRQRAGCTLITGQKA
jgi:DNA modification methylase